MIPDSAPNGNMTMPTPELGLDPIIPDIPIRLRDPEIIAFPDGDLCIIMKTSVGRQKGPL